MRSITSILGLSLAALLVVGVATEASSQEAIINSVGIDSNGDLQGFLELYKSGQMINKRLGNPAGRVWQATLAGQQTNSVIIITEHANLVAMAHAQSKQQGDEEWQKLIQDAQKKGITATSNSVWTEITPGEAVEAAEGSVIQFVGIDTNGDLPGFLKISERARAISARLETGGVARTWQATLAGDQTNSVGIGIEYASLEAYAQAAAKQSADAEWQKLIQDVQENGMSATSSSLWTDITP